ncbi:hypothetical protein P8452_61112 [Trifolium repens]|nr:hypothetical protein P8452_61112 [Trifolium repens]
MHVLRLRTHLCRKSLCKIFGDFRLIYGSFLDWLIRILLWLALCVATNRSTWFGTTVLVTNMRNFPLSRGTISGILKGLDLWRWYTSHW